MMLYLLQLWSAARRRPLVAGFLVVAAVAGALNYPLWQHGREIERRHEEVRQRGQAVLEALADRQRLYADLAAVDDTLDVIDRDTVREQTMEANLGYFYRLEKISRVHLDRIDQLAATAAEAGNPYKTVPVSLKVTGSYRNLLEFLRDIENGPHFVHVRNYRVERTDGKDGDVLLVLTLELLAHT